MRFGFYRRLDKAERRVYDASDAIARVELADPSAHRKHAAVLERALAAEDRAAVEQAARGLVRQILRSLGAPPVAVRVLARRPKNHGGELHGLYTQETDGRAHLEVWMRTAEQRRVVAFRTFLRTLLHEVCHHLDLTLFGLAETFHTEGFFRRESSLVRQIAGTAPRRRPSRPAAGARASGGAAKPDPRKPRKRSTQLSLFS